MSKFLEWAASCAKLELKEPQDRAWFKKHITGTAGPFFCNFSMDVRKVDGSDPIRPTVEELKKRLYGSDEEIKRTRVPVWAADEQTKKITYDGDLLHSFFRVCEDHVTDREAKIEGQGKGEKKRKKDSAASSNSEPNVKIRLKLVAGPGPEKTYIVKGPAAAPRMCIICCRFCCFLSLVMWVLRRESVEAAKGTLIKAATFYPASGYLSLSTLLTRTHPFSPPQLRRHECARRCHEACCGGLFM